MRALLCALLLAYLASAQRAQAQPALTDNDYQIDLFQGPVLGGGRIVGMAGAYSAIATGIDGSVFNPAGYAERAEQELDWWDWELTGGVWLGGLFTRNDVDNNGRNDLTTQDALQLSAGARMQFGFLGTGLTALSQNYTLKDADNGTAADISFTTIRGGGAYAWLDGGLVTGASLRGSSFAIDDDGTGKSLISFNGLGAEIGALIRPKYERYRIGATVRTPITAKPDDKGMEAPADGVRRVQGFVIPSSVHVPWELEAGFAYQLGERRTNAPWRHTKGLRSIIKRELEAGTYTMPDTFGGPPYPSLPTDDPRKALRTAFANDREAERRYLRHQPRRYLLLSGDVILYGPTPRGQGVNQFLLQKRESSGARTSLGLRVGSESEVVQNRLRLRAGAYLEPSRYRRSFYRPHGTLGCDVRMFDLWRWSLRGTATIDLAPRYFNWGLSVGFWY